MSGVGGKRMCCFESGLVLLCYPGGFIFILLVAGVEWKCMSRKIAARLQLLQEHAWGSQSIRGSMLWRVNPGWSTHCSLIRTVDFVWENNPCLMGP